MRFEDERYVRVYTRKTVTTVKLGWEGRAVWDALLKEFDRAGIVSLSGETPVDAVHMLTKIPIQIVTIAIERLFEAGTLAHYPKAENGRGVLFAPRFMEAQEAKQSNALKQRLKRERTKARERLVRLNDTSGVASDTSGVADSDGGVEPQDEPEQQGADTAGVASDTFVSPATPEVSGATLFDTPSQPSQPSRAEEDLPNCKRSSKTVGTDPAGRPKPRADLLSKKIGMPDYAGAERWDDAVAYAGELGLAFHEYESCVVELRDKQGSRKHDQAWWDDKLLAFIESKANRNGGRREATRGNSESSPEPRRRAAAHPTDGAAGLGAEWRPSAAAQKRIDERRAKRRAERAAKEGAVASGVRRGGQ